MEVMRHIYKGLVISYDYFNRKWSQNQFQIQSVSLDMLKKKIDKCLLDKKVKVFKPTSSRHKIGTLIGVISKKNDFSHYVVDDGKGVGVYAIVYKVTPESIVVFDRHDIVKRKISRLYDKIHRLESELVKYSRFPNFFGIDLSMDKVPKTTYLGFKITYKDKPRRWIVEDAGYEGNTLDDAIMEIRRNVFDKLEKKEKIVLFQSSTGMKFLRATIVKPKSLQGMYTVSGKCGSCCYVYDVLENTPDNKKILNLLISARQKLFKLNREYGELTTRMKGFNMDFMLDQIK